jgi:SAM-dependent methyltransferase
MVVATHDPALAAYEALAPFYDRFMGGYDNDRWLAGIEGIARAHGLSGRRLLDVGCGTGRSFLPLLARGYEVTACDLSPAMVERALEATAGTDAELLVADARELPALGRFDLVTSLDDTLNYLLSDTELEAAFRGMARNLRPGGLLVFDLNSLRTYRHFFARDMARDGDGAFFCWHGEGAPEAAPGCFASAVIEVFATDDGECWRRTSSRHVQRHHPFEVVRRLLADCGFELLERRGQVTGARIDPVGDEEAHVKLVHFARRRFAT